MSRNSFPLKSAEYSSTAISCRPPSDTFVSVDKYEYSLGKAEDAFDDRVCVLAIKLVSTVEVSRGIGSSGLLDWARRGSKGLYGSGCAEKAFGRVGTPR